MRLLLPLSFLCAALAVRADPLVILVSIDGARWDYPELHEAPFLQHLSTEGLRVERLVPSYPSKTFPNHYTLVTGLRPQTHGIVQNRFYDPAFQAWFGIGAHPAARDGRWWGGEPIWQTLQRQGGRAFCLFWPGSEADIGGQHPDRWQRYDGDLPYNERIDHVLEWTALPAHERPHLITLYFEGVDTAGHRHGPTAPETRVALQAADRALARLADGLRGQGRWEETTLIVTADHGMTAIAPEREILLDDLIDPAQVQVVFSGAIGGFNVQPGGDPIALRDQFRLHPHLDAYRREEVPERLHFSANPRIPDLIVIPELGWELQTRGWIERRKYPDRGDHGFDPAAPDMGALFIARGPLLPAGHRLPPVENIAVYNLLCALLEIDPAPNEGDDSLVQAAFSLEFRL